MSKITALKANKRNGKRVNLFLDGRFAFSVDTEVAVREGLKPGQELSDDQIRELTEDISLVRILNIAYRFLSYRPRSEAEMKERLHRRAIEDSKIEIVINKLKE